MYCSRCGSLMSDNSIFCSKCGNKVQSGVSTVGSQTNTYQSIYREYFAIVMQMEVLIDLLEMILLSLKTNKPVKIDINNIDKGWERERKNKIDLKKEVKPANGFLTLILLLLGVPLGAFLISGFALLFMQIISLGGVLFEWSQNKTIEIWFCIGAVFITFVVLADFFGSRSDQKNIQEFNVNVEKENLDIDDYNNKLLIEHNKKVNIEKQKNEELIRSWDNEYRQINSYKTRTKDILERLYGLEYVYKSYRNLGAIIHMNQAMESQRAKSIQDAYNLYEQEKPMHDIIERLDQTNRLLGRIVDRMDFWGSSIVNLLNENQKIASEYPMYISERVSRMGNDDIFSNTTYAKEKIENRVERICKKAIDYCESHRM